MSSLLPLCIPNPHYRTSFPICFLTHFSPRIYICPKLKPFWLQPWQSLYSLSADILRLPHHHHHLEHYTLPDGGALLPTGQISHNHCSKRSFYLSSHHFMAIPARRPHQKISDIFGISIKLKKVKIHISSMDIKLWVADDSQPSVSVLLVPKLLPFSKQYA